MEFPGDDREAEVTSLKDFWDLASLCCNSRTSPEKEENRRMR